MFFRRFDKRDNTGLHYQFIVPRSMQKEIMAQLHESLISRHLGKKKYTLQRFHWYRVRDDVKQFVKQCDNCEEGLLLGKSQQECLCNGYIRFLAYYCPRESVHSGRNQLFRKLAGNPGCP